MIKPMDVTPEVIHALSYLRAHAKIDARQSVKDAFEVLEDLGVFAEIDEVIDNDKIPDPFRAEERQPKLPPPGGYKYQSVQDRFI